MKIDEESLSQNTIIKFENIGEYSYKCAIHSIMKGNIKVIDCF